MAQDTVYINMKTQKRDPGDETLSCGCKVEWTVLPGQEVTYAKDGSLEKPVCGMDTYRRCPQHQSQHRFRRKVGIAALLLVVLVIGGLCVINGVS